MTLERTIRRHLIDAKRGLRAKRLETRLRNEGRVAALQRALVAVRLASRK